MGPDSNSPAPVIEVGGARFQLGTVPHIVSLDTEPAAGIDGVCWREPITVTGTFRLKRISRRRFMKLLMARGVPRNTAECIAWVTQLLHIPYARALMELAVNGDV